MTPKAPALLFSVLFIVQGIAGPCASAQPLGLTEGVYTVVNKIEMQRYNWLGYKADVKLNFTTRYGQTAACHGDLTYYRLEERMLLQCYNSSKNMLFIFKTNDLDFDMFLPKQKTLYRGNIFDLEYTEAVDSHIKPLDLYRGLKPMLIPYEKVKPDTQDSVLTSFWVEETHRRQTYWGRRVTANAKGDVLSETYYGPDGKATLQVNRTDFKKVSGKGHISRDPLRFPYRIKIQNLKDQTRVELLFIKIEVLQNPSAGNWKIIVPPGTQTMVFPKIQPESF